MEPFTLTYDEILEHLHPLSPLPGQPQLMRILSAFVVLLFFAGCKPSPTGKWRPNDFYTDRGAAALCQAAERNDLAEIDRLLDSGVDVNARGRDGMTPLLWAMWAKAKGGFRRLLERGADPNIQLDRQDDCNSVTSAAAGCTNDSEWLELVLKHDGNPNLVNHAGYTFDAIDIEGDGKQPAKAKTFCINPTPIFNAVDSGNLHHVELLIQAGANLNYHGEGGDTPAMYAAWHRNFAAVYRLLEAGADYRIKTNDAGNDLACTVAENSCAVLDEQKAWRDKVIEFLEKKGVDMKAAREKAAE